MKLSELRAHADALGFTPMPSVRWLAPGQLVRTGVKVLLSKVFASYDDKRELQAIFASELLRADRDTEELWLDYVADVGDGFDAAYTVAWLLGRDDLEVDDKRRLPRGSMLVLGGDEAYPAASAAAYDNRLRGPYRAALPAAEEHPLLVALPGNHDWYDGLTSFLRVFTQGGHIGARRLRQARSYFAVRLPQRWWLLGLDTHLGTHIDGPQLDYFHEHVSTRLRPGDGVIIAAPTPTWVHSAVDDAQAFDTLHWFERNYIRTRRNHTTGEREPTGASVRLWLSGDSHHYARYAERLPGEAAVGELSADTRRRQMVTCGLGGAYLSGTHHLPDRLLLPSHKAHPHRDDEQVAYTRANATCPDAATSRAWSRRVAQPWSRFWLARRNPGFADLVAGVQVALYLVAAFVFGQARAQPSMTAVRTANLPAVGVFDLEALAAVAIVLLLPWFLRVVRTRTWSAPSTMVLGVLLQVLVALISLTVFVAVPWPASWVDVAVLVLSAAGAGVIGAGLGSQAFALYLLSARSGPAAHLRMSSQAIEECKGFVRLHIGDDGDLTLYPLVTRAVCHDWTLADDPTMHHARPVPGTTPRPTLIEDPVVVARQVDDLHR